MCVLMTRKGALHMFQEIALAFISTRKPEKSWSRNYTLMWLLAELLKSRWWICPILCFTHHWPLRALLSEPAGFLHPFCSKGCKIYVEALKGFWENEIPLPVPKETTRLWGEIMRILQLVIVAAVAGPTELVVEEEKWCLCLLPSHASWSWRKCIFCHLQTIFHLGRAAAWKNSAGRKAT